MADGDSVLHVAAGTLLLVEVAGVGEDAFEFEGGSDEAYEAGIDALGVVDAVGSFMGEVGDDEGAVRFEEAEEVGGDFAVDVFVGEACRAGLIR